MTKEQREEAFKYIESQLEYGYLDLGLHDQNELEIVKEAIKILLKKQLDDDIKDVPSTETLVNKMCASEEDHEWECCGMSTVGSDYRCKKCGAYKTIPIEYQPLSVTI